MPKISELPAGTTPDGTEVTAAVQGGVTVKVAFGAIGSGTAGQVAYYAAAGNKVSGSANVTIGAGFPAGLALYTNNLNVYPVNTDNGVQIGYGTGGGAGGGGAITFYSKNAAGAPISLNQELGFLEVHGAYDGTNYDFTGSPIALVFSTTQAWTASAQGCGIVIQGKLRNTTSATGELSIAEGLTVMAATDTAIVTGLGQGTLNARNGVYDGANRVVSASSSVLTLSQNNGTSIAVSNTNAGVQASAQLSGTSNAGTGAFGAASALYNTVPLLAGSAYAYGVGVPIVVGTNAANPIVFGTSSTERARILTGFMVGTTTDPGAGAIAANTSVQSPIYKASGALTFQSNGTTFAGDITTGQQWFLGSTLNAPPTGPQLTVSKNTSALPATGTPTGITGTAQAVASFGGVDGSSADLLIYTFGGTANIRYLVSGGTAASRTATSSTLGANFWYGSKDSATYAAGAGFNITATEAWDATHTGTRLELYATPTGGTSLGVAAYFAAGVSLGSATDPGAGALSATASIKSSGATSGAGYATGAGGTVTQGTNRTTGVTINKVCGAITLFSQVNSAVSGATAQTFTVTNSAVAATDTVIVNQQSGTDKYLTFVTNVAAGSFAITNYTTGGTTNEAPVFNFSVIKGVTA